MPAAARRRLSPEAVSQEIAARLAESGSRKPVREVLRNEQAYCECCRRTIERGEVAWIWTRRVSGRWRDVITCAEHAPCEPDVKVGAMRQLTWNFRNSRVVQTGKRGRPAIHFTPTEVELVRSLRDDRGLGERRLADQFIEETGRRVSARCLAKVGREPLTRDDEPYSIEA